MDLTELKRTISLCKEGINTADQNLIKLTGRNYDKTDNLANNQRFLNKRRSNVDHDVPNEIKKPRNDKDGPSLNSVVQMTKGRTRDDALTELKNKENAKDKERCRRLFGHLMGTLNSIKKDAEKSTNDPQNITRLKIEKKVEEGNKLINETIQKEQSELLRSKRERQNDLKILNQRYRAAEAFDRWRNEKEKMKGFIRTSKTPFVFYKPCLINEEAQLRIDSTAREIDSMIETRKKKLEGEIIKAVKYSEQHLEGGNINIKQELENVNSFDRESRCKETGEFNNSSNNNLISNHNDNDKKKGRSRSPVESLTSEDYEDMIEEIEISMHDENPAVHEEEHLHSVDIVKDEEHLTVPGQVPSSPSPMDTIDTTTVVAADVVESTTTTSFDNTDIDNIAVENIVAVNDDIEAKQEQVESIINDNVPEICSKDD